MDSLLHAGQLALCFAAAASFTRWIHLSKADRILSCLLILTLVQEAVSYWLIIVMRKGNMITYHIYSPVELLLICLWIHTSHPWPRARAISLLCGIGGCLFSAINTISLQPTYTANTNFLLVEGALIIQLSLTSLAGTALREDIAPYKTAHFWIALSLVFYWSITLIAYGVIGFLSEEAVAVTTWARYTLLLANILFYTSLGVIFLRYKKLIPSGA